jgi:hypothetical protein
MSRLLSCLKPQVNAPDPISERYRLPSVSTSPITTLEILAYQIRN